MNIIFFLANNKKSKKQSFDVQHFILNAFCMVFWSFRRSAGVPIPAGAVPRTATGPPRRSPPSRGTRRRESPGVRRCEICPRDLPAPAWGTGSGPAEWSGRRAGNLKKVGFLKKILNSLGNGQSTSPMETHPCQPCAQRINAHLYIN